MPSSDIAVPVGVIEPSAIASSVGVAVIDSSIMASSSPSSSLEQPRMAAAATPAPPIANVRSTLRRSSRRSVSSSRRIRVTSVVIDPLRRRKLRARPSHLVTLLTDVTGPDRGRSALVRNAAQVTLMVTRSCSKIWDLRPASGETRFPVVGRMASILPLREIPQNVASGIVVGLIAFPLSIALAVAAGVPPIAGLYTA
ncbi:MAG: hypothetical protein KC461_00130, partial [Dehalococcoidia bacterium]|nr:hypothetical protein [Dehalococcoidia bacterium]